ncbi:Cro/Cl family transcriptional regulator [Ralstonia mannitolilytica]|uniref:Cro/Cl family transcriptional regulator n=1 Tax=Ralstonia mannitolilytica TaxID=105219 RepID=UPI001C236155|nr:Cro/Cl family transcriptional regulator [Ralstonia mannitolilytica]MBU9579588.1 Cro/Cl family transcriptional regulator [Ralstonia mannitolilytica]
MVMTKKEAIGIFGSGAALGRALGVSRAAIWQWPDELDQKQTDTVVGAAIRLGKALPPGFVPAASAEHAAA